jgi:membrane protein required for colicin V production
MNWIDILLIVLVGCSFIAGLMRGLLREVIALVTWITAVWFAWHYSSLVASHLGDALTNEELRTWVARALVFLAIMVIGGTIGLLLSHMVRLSIFSGTDRAVGGLFGLLRGAVMAGLFVMLCHAVRLEGEPWWHRSLLVPYAEHAANVLRAMVGERKLPAGNSVAATR